MSASERERRGKKEDSSISDWKHSQISDPDDIDALSDILSREIEKEFIRLEADLADYWHKSKKNSN